VVGALLIVVAIQAATLVALLIRGSEMRVRSEPFGRAKNNFVA
jgi:hypothetical protein